MEVSFKPQRDVRNAFATPVAQIHIPEGAEIKAGLLRIIAEAEAASPSEGRSNVGGWPATPRAKPCLAHQIHP